MELKYYKDNGYYIHKQLIDKKICNNIIKQLEDIKTNMKIPNTNIQFGYGNLINHKISEIVTNNKFVKTFCNSIYGPNYYYNSLYIHNKHRWVGPDIEWHQEVFNINTFFPTDKNYTIEEIKNNFMQIYVALENQTLENGCMKIIPYQNSILKHYDTTNIHLNHKRAILPNELDKIYNKYGIINLELKAGDVVFFNHLIPHSSTSNNGPYDRKAMVFLTYKNIEDINENIRFEDQEYRKNFAINYLNTVLENKTQKPIYECGKEQKKVEISWNNIFEEIPWFKEDIKDYSLETLLKLNGHLTTHSKFDVNTWLNTITHFKKQINYEEKKNYKILEVGCGAGALLKVFEKNNQIYGIDPSKTYINIISKALPNGKFKIGDALNIDSYNDNYFDIIFCHSTTQYFKDLNYFDFFIDLCYQKLKPQGKLCITEIHDNDMKENYIKHRINIIGKDKYKEKYENTNLKHFYISKNKIISVLKNNFSNIKFSNSIKRGQETEFYRINLFCDKNDYITKREYNLLTNENTMEKIFILKDFPVSLSCIPVDLEHNKKLDMIFDICKKTGIIQIRNAPLLEDIYIIPHNSSIGKIWNNLFELFNKILLKYIEEDNNILEIGGGNLLLASKILKNKKIKKYTVYEKNINLSNCFLNDKRINLVNDYITNKTDIKEHYKFYIHSHVLEHVWNPKDFIECIEKNIKLGCYHCFIVPNLKETFSKKYTNALDFEHNFFIIEEYIDVILYNNNFEIVEKEFYLDHSIIYITRKIENTNFIEKIFPNLYEKNKALVLDFYDYHINLIKILNNKIDKFNGELYLFGGTGFSIYLIIFGLKTDKIIYILDNDPDKENKKVYGTNFIVKNPNIIKDKNNIAVIVKVGSYQQEIEEQLYNLNKKTLILK